MDDLTSTQLNHIKVVIDLRFEAHAREHQLLKEMVILAREDIARRLDAMNDLRAQINDERGTYMTREIYERFHSALETRVSVAERSVLLLPSRADLDQRVTTTDSRLRVVEDWRNRAIGMSAVFGALAGALFGILSSLLAHYIRH